MSILTFSTVKDQAESILTKMRSDKITPLQAELQFVQLRKRHEENWILHSVILLYHAKSKQRGDIKSEKIENLKSGIRMLRMVCLAMCREKEPEYKALLAETQLVQAKYVMEIGRRLNLVRTTTYNPSQALGNYEYARRLAYNAKQALIKGSVFYPEAISLIDQCDEAITRLRPKCSAPSRLSIVA